MKQIHFVRHLSISITGICAAAVCGPVHAMDDPAISETIVVVGQRTDSDAASFETRHVLSAEEVANAAALTADGLLRDLPSVHVPTNSRGEAIAFVRNATERQVVIFYDGAAINVPWDNRLDLSLVPAALIGTVQSAAGPLAPHYGVNALGAISLAPRSSMSASFLAGNAGQLAADGLVPAGPIAAGVSYAKRNWDPLSDDADLPFHQVSEKQRTNTDVELASVFGHAATDLGGHQLRLTAFHVWGEKGIAPEGDRPGARFWRYPDVSHTLVVLGAHSQLGTSTELSSSFWNQRFDQTIDSFTNARYDVRNAREIDRDRTWGIRELLRHGTGPLTLVGSANFLHSTHKQRDIAYLAGQPPAALPEALHYGQCNWSVGGEIEYALSSALVAEVGLGLDNVDYVRTGDKPPIKDAQDWTGRVGLLFIASRGWRLRAAVGRKMRAATMRELFGQALNRFLINPDLKPEQIWTAEAAVEWQGKLGSFYVIPFLQDLDNTIDQRNVGSLRQRINLKGSTVKGIEIGGVLRPAEAVSLSGDATWARARRKGIESGGEDRLAEKPNLLARMSVSYDHPSGVGVGLEAEHVGSAYSVNAAGVLIPLKTSTSFNARISYPISVGGHQAQIFFHVDNIADSLVEPQLGLPAPGRTFHIGLRLNAATGPEH